MLDRQFRDLFEAASDAIIVIDENQGIVAGNEEAESIFGYPRAEVLGQPVAMLVPSRFRARHRAHVQGFRDGDEGRRLMSTRTELVGVRRSGDEFPVEITISKLGERGGDLVMAIVRDVTEQRAAEAARREYEQEQIRIQAERRLVAAFANAPIGMGLTSPDGRLLRVNAAFCDMMGYSEERLLTMTWRDYTYPADIKSDQAEVDRLLSAPPSADSKRVGMVEKRYIRADGTTIWVVLTMALVRDPSGEPGYFVTHAQDITERKETHRALAKAEERFRTAFNYAPIGMALVAPDGRFTTVNSTFCQMLGYSADRLCELSITEITHPDDVEETRVALGDVLDGEAETLSLEKRLIAADGHVVPIIVDTTLVRDLEGQPLYFIAHLVDLSGLHEANRQLLEAHVALEESARLKDEFFAGMSHELRTPLSAIIGLSSILERQTFGLLNDKQTSYVDEIGRSGRHLLALIDDLLDLEKIAAVTEDLEIGPVHLPTLIRGAVSMLRETATAKGLQIREDISPDLLVVSGDERRLKQVLVNLLSNAVKFTPEGGRVGVEAKQAAGQTHITVWDTGVGIPRKHQHLLFHRYPQLGTSLSQEQVGSGLGLALSQRLMQLHDGFISVESAEGDGSRFTMQWPINSATNGEIGPEGQTGTDQIRQGADPAASRSSAGDTVTVLVVEDNQVNRMMLVDYLESRNITVHCAEDGFEMIAQTKAVKPDLILMDIQLPRMDGITATRLLKSDPATRHIPCIALTALAMSGDADRCIEAGCDAYLSKPVDLDQMLSLIIEFTSTATEEEVGA